MGSGLFFCRSVGSHASSRLYFPHHDISVLETHLTFGMDLDTNGAFGDDGVGGVGHDLLAVQPGGVGVATDTDFDPIPVFHVKVPCPCTLLSLNSPTYIPPYNV